jgi:hypothetical protein
MAGQAIIKMVPSVGFDITQEEKFMYKKGLRKFHTKKT